MASELPGSTKTMILAHPAGATGLNERERLYRKEPANVFLSFTIVSTNTGGLLVVYNTSDIYRKNGQENNKNRMNKVREYHEGSDFLCHTNYMFFPSLVGG